MFQWTTLEGPSKSDFTLQRSGNFGIMLPLLCHVSSYWWTPGPSIHKYFVIKSDDIEKNISSTICNFPRPYFFCASFSYLCLVFVMLPPLFIAALWSRAGKGLTSWLSFVMFYCVLSLSQVVSCICQVWYSIVSIPDLCHLSYFTY